MDRLVDKKTHHEKGGKLLGGFCAFHNAEP